MCLANDITQEIILVVSAKNTDTAKKELEKVSSAMEELSDHEKTSEQITKRKDATTGKSSTTLKAKYVPSQQLATKELRRFKMEALGTLFGGLALEKMFGKITQAGFDLYQVGDLYNTTFGVLMLPVMEILGETIFGVADALMSLPDDAKLALGTTLLLGQGFGMLVSSLSSAVLFLNSLEKIGGLGGLVDAFSEAGGFLGKYANKVLSTTISFSSSLSESIMPFFNKAGNWILGNVKSIVNMVEGQIDKSVEWLHGVTGLETGGLGKTIKLAVSIGAVWAMLEIATGALKWIFEAMGNTFGGKNTDIGSLLLHISGKMEGGFFGTVMNAIKDAVSLPLNIELALKNGNEFQKLIATAVKNALNMTTIGQMINISGALSKVWPFAEGGIVTRPTMGLVGEAGPEAIIPLNKLSDVSNNSNSVYAPNVNIEANISSDYDLANLAEKLNNYMYQDYKRLKTTWA